MKHPLTNVPSSVRQRLLNLSQQRGEEFQFLLVRYANERLMFRLTVSPHADDFILKGAMLLYAWSPYPFRATQDVGLLGRGDVTAERLAAVFRGLCTSAIVDDGLVFRADSVRVGLIRQEDEHGGFRVNVQAQLTSARIDLQVDVGVGDTVARPSLINYPTLLDFPAPRLRAYSREASIAEKFHAMLVHGLENSRMKDFFDVWALSREFVRRRRARRRDRVHVRPARYRDSGGNTGRLHAAIRLRSDEGQAVEGLPRAFPGGEGAAGVRRPARARRRVSPAGRRRGPLARRASQHLAPRWTMDEGDPVRRVPSDAAPEDERVDRTELLDILREAAARRNGWKVILARCAPPPRKTRAQVVRELHEAWVRSRLSRST